MKTNSLFLPFFNLKECHYDNSSTNACNPFQSQGLPTPLGVVEMLELVVTSGFNFILTGVSAASCNDVVTPFYLDIRFQEVEIPTSVTFSIRAFSTIFRGFFPETLQTLNSLPSVLYKSVGRRQ
jgi:hypothetical protein